MKKCSRLAAAVIASFLVVTAATVMPANAKTVEHSGCRLFAKGVYAGSAPQMQAGARVLNESRKPGYVSLMAQWYENAVNAGDIVDFCHRNFSQRQGHRGRFEAALTRRARRRSAPLNVLTCVG
jgi:hypothetical protein